MAGVEGKARKGKDRPVRVGKVRQGQAGEAWRGLERFGPDRQVGIGLAGDGGPRTGLAGTGEAGCG